MLFVLIATTVLLKTISAEECIDYEDHGAETHECCSYVPPYPRDALKACQSEAQTKAGRDRHDLMACMFQCYFNALGIVNGDEHTLNLDKIAEYLKDLNEDARTTIIDAYKECADDNSSGAVDVCNSYAMDIEICALHLIARRCPEDLFNPSELCDKFRSGLAFC